MLAGPWHPGCNVVPAALALGEQFGTSGAHFLRAVVLGYDVGTRLLAAVLPGMANSHKLSYGIGGVFGALGRESHAVQHFPIQTFEIEVRRNAVHEAEAEGLGCRKESEAGTGRRVAFQARVDTVGVECG